MWVEVEGPSQQLSADGANDVNNADQVAPILIKICALVYRRLTTGRQS